MGYITQAISFNDRFNINRTNNSTFFKGDLLNLIQKYPMLWGWLLDYNPTDTHVNQTMQHALNNTYGIANNPIKPDPTVVTTIENNMSIPPTGVDDKIVLAYLQKAGYLYAHETLNVIGYAREQIRHANQYKQQQDTYTNQLQNTIKNMNNEINRLNNELNNAQGDSNHLNQELLALQEKFKNIPPPPTYSNNFWNNPTEYYQSAKAEIFTNDWLDKHKNDWLNKNGLVNNQNEMFSTNIDGWQ